MHHFQVTHPFSKACNHESQISHAWAVWNVWFLLHMISNHRNLKSSTLIAPLMSLRESKFPPPREYDLLHGVLLEHEPPHCNSYLARMWLKVASNLQNVNTRRIEIEPHTYMNHSKFSAWNWNCRIRNQGWITVTGCIESARLNNASVYYVKGHPCTHAYTIFEGIANPQLTLEKIRAIRVLEVL